MRGFAGISRLAAALVALLAPLAAAEAQGTVQGTVRYDDEAVAMTHVVARQTRPSPTSEEPPHTVVLITDRAPPPAVAGSRQAYYAAAREGRLHGLLIVVEPSGPRLHLFAPGDAVASTSVPDIFRRVQLDDFVHADGWISGHLRTSEPGEFELQGPNPQGPSTYSLDIRFRAPVAPGPRPTETLTGEAARNSPLAEAAARALDTVRTGSLADLRASLHPSHPFRDSLEGEQAEAILAMARDMMPAPAEFRASIERVIVYGDEAVVAARDAEGWSSVSLRREGGVWKLADAPIAND